MAIFLYKQLNWYQEQFSYLPRIHGVRDTCYVVGSSVFVVASDIGAVALVYLPSPGSLIVKVETVWLF